MLLHDEEDNILEDVLRRVAEAPPVAPSLELTREQLGRFVVEDLAAQGGMGAVYRALDPTTGALVAVKVVRVTARSESREVIQARFAREARLLASLRHPAIVRYIDHGVTSAGAYLVMEWLEGQDLAQHLKSGPLNLDDALALAIRAAEGLEHAHERGIVHRDLKPANIFLRDRRPERAVLLDLGLARIHDAGGLTASGVVMGTAGYMAPEQIEERAVDHRADLFALGCVLYEAIAGAPLFHGANAAAVLARLLLETPRRLATVKVVPAELDRLIAALVDKDPARRPPNAAAVLEVLRSIPRGAAPEAPPPALTTSEQRIVCAIAVEGTSAQTPGERVERLLAVRSAVRARDLRSAALPDGSIIAVLTTTGSLSDQAVLAARYALALRSALGGASIAVAAGRADLSGVDPTGEVIDQALRILNEQTFSVGPRLDKIIAELLAGRFELEESGECTVLRGELRALDAERHLLGRATPLVGRAGELATLKAAYNTAVSESVARAVVVTAAAGMGKSRLRRELISGLMEHEPSPTVLAAFGDPTRAGSALGMAAQLVRSALDGADRSLSAHLSRMLEGDTLARVGEFLGELIGAPAAGEPSPRLRSARGDPRILGDQLRSAWQDWLHAECARGPVVLILEDLQWGDRPTVRFIHEALRDLSDRPLLVIALGRDETLELFPDLWAERGAQHVRLTRLSRRASEELIHHVLGWTLPRPRVEELVERGGGNAFFLEELIRAVAEKRDAGSLPETVLATVQGRIAALSSETRRVLRAASIYGDVFWREGVEVLLGGAPCSEHLAALVDTELLVRRHTSRFAGREELAFQHSLLREAAYSMLAPGDQTAGHARAGVWLEEAGENDALALASHFERGAEPGHARKWYLRAAYQALEGSDMPRAIELAERVVAAGASGVELGSARELQAYSHTWRSELHAAHDRSLEAFRLLKPGTDLWYRSAIGVLVAAPHRNRFDHFEEVTRALLQVPALEQPTGACTFGLMMAGQALTLAGRRAPAARIVAHAESMLEAVAGRDPSAAGYIHLNAAMVRELNGGSPWRALLGGRAALAALEEAGDRRGAALSRWVIGGAMASLGAHELALAELEAARAWAEAAGAHYVADVAAISVAWELTAAGRSTESIAIITRVRSAAALRKQLYFEGMHLATLARACCAAQRMEEAEAHARGALERLVAGSPPTMSALAALAAVELARGRHAAALQHAERAIAVRTSTGGILPAMETEAVLAHALALRANGREEPAAQAIAEECARLLQHASEIEDPALRTSFFERVPAHTRLFLEQRTSG